MEWAASLGFPRAVSVEWAAATTAAAAAAPGGPEEPHSLVDLAGFPESLSWEQRPVGAAATRACLAQLESWSDFARSARAACRRADSRAYLDWRASSLRQGDLRTWARAMRPKPARSPGYAPAWFTTEDGLRARPGSAADVALGAAQEWGALLQEPADAWSYPLFAEWRDASGRRRGSVSAPAVCAADPGSGLRRVADALLDPAPWRIVRWAAADVSGPPLVLVRRRRLAAAPAGGRWVGGFPPGPLQGARPASRQRQRWRPPRMDRRPLVPWEP